MEDSESAGIVSFDFEGGLDSAAADGRSVINPNLSAISVSASHPAVSGAAAAPDNVIGRRSFRRTVCRHWLRGLCMKGESCGFLHQFDKSRMPVCRYFRLYGECREKDCLYKHTNGDVKECNMYKLGFCPNGPDCRYRHVKFPGPPPPVEDVLQKARSLWFGGSFSGGIKFPGFSCGERISVNDQCDRSDNRFDQGCGREMFGPTTDDETHYRLRIKAQQEDQSVAAAGSMQMS